MPEKADAVREVEAKLELVGAVALLSVTAVVKALQTRVPGELLDAQRTELLRVREDLGTALRRLDEQLASGKLQGLDLSGLRDKLARTISTLEEWPLGEKNLPS